jgi:glycosyltransferase involved in cell wall biosynthesis
MTSRGKRSRHSAIILSSKPSNWGSCKIITPNLEAAYRSFNSEDFFFSYTLEDKITDLLRTARSILQARPARIIFIDHVPHPQRLLQALVHLSGRKPLPELIFHCYGDFTLYPTEWCEIEDILKKTSCKFIAASPRSSQLISGFFRNKSLVSYCPFPVNERTFFFDQGVRQKFRKEFGLQDNDKLFVYTGRISSQKNTLPMLKIFAELAKKHPNLYFFIAGNFDDLAAPFFGIQSLQGTMKKRYLEFMGSLSKDIQLRIRYLGNFQFEELLPLYNGADVFASLSTHHDEDFGMSPIESLFCGTLAILSSWGGYPGFALDKNLVKLVPVRIDRGIAFNKQIFMNEVSRLMSLTRTPTERLQSSNLFKENFSIDASVEILKKIQAKAPIKFSGFSLQMRNYKTQYEIYKSGKSPLYPLGPIKKGLYYEVYKPYIKDI